MKEMVGRGRGKSHHIFHGAGKTYGHMILGNGHVDELELISSATLDCFETNLPIPPSISTARTALA
ncbi:hypothetical protein [uncultured Desulfobacter sp.]|uniref:hypothetical protein n=1 Tax=uncultured Desulfobacter sp. TaxID=240139 RepID=UPI0029F53575|nr:hypothetical protein [uncultured Desulfobacter sp.]